MVAEELFLGARFKYSPDYSRSNLASVTIESEKKISEKIRSGIYSYEYCSCYCGSNEFIKLSEIDLYGHYYPFVICKKCGIMRANPRLTEASLKDIYLNDYRNIYGNVGRNKEDLYLARLDQSEKMHAIITQHVPLPSGAVVFDIGCHIGTALIPFHDQGCDVMGVDLGIEGIEFGKRKSGLNLAVGGIDQLKESGKKADLVILNHVFEHFFDLDQKIKEISQVMKPNGYIFVAVPGTFWWIKNLCGGDIVNMLQSAHIWQFSLNTMRYVFECSGFETVYGDEKILSIFRKSDKPPRRRDDFSGGECARVTAYLKRVERKHFFKRAVRKAISAIGLYDILKQVFEKKRDARLTLINRYYSK